MSSFLADAYIIQIQKYEVPAPQPSNPPVSSVSTILNKLAPTTSTATQSTILGSNAAHVAKLPIATTASQSISATLAGQPMSGNQLGTALKIGDASIRPSLKVAITQAAALAAKTSAGIASSKSLTSIPIQIGTGAQIKNQHITLAALNQLTAGKISGSQTISTQGKTVQIISPSKPGQVQGLQKLQVNPKVGINNPILSLQKTPSSTQQTVKLLTQQTSVTVASTIATTVAAPTQYALVRAQLPGTGGAPPQTVTFIRAISPNTSSTSTGGTTVTVTPQQMAALLKGQQGQTQIQKVLSAATGTPQIRAQVPASPIKLTQTSPGKQVLSVQFNPRGPNVQGLLRQPVAVSAATALLANKLPVVTTQTSHVSPMATLVSGAGLKVTSASPISLVNQFPAVRPQIQVSLSNVNSTVLPAIAAATAVTSQLGLTSVSSNANSTVHNESASITSASSSISISSSETNISSSSVNTVTNLIQPNLDSVQIAEDPHSTKTVVSDQLSLTNQLDATTGLDDNSMSSAATDDASKAPSQIEQCKANAPDNTNIVMHSATDSLTNDLSNVYKCESKMEIDVIPEREEEKPKSKESMMDEKPPSTGDVKPVDATLQEMIKEEEIKKEEDIGSSVESLAATTLASLGAQIVSTEAGGLSGTSLVNGTAVTDMQDNALSTLAALATSSAIATEPLLTSKNVDQVAMNQESVLAASSLSTQVPVKKVSIDALPTS